MTYIGKLSVLPNTASDLSVETQVESLLSEFSAPKDMDGKKQSPLYSIVSH